MNISPGIKTFYYLDYSGSIQKNQYSDGYFARLTRLITSLWRNYDLFRVHAAFNNQTDSCISTEDKEFVSKKLFTKCGITEEQRKNLISITSNGYGSSSEFLREIHSNKKFNNGIKKILANCSNFSEISNQTLGEVSAFSYKTTQRKAFIATANKAEDTLFKYTNSQPIPKTGKLTLKEVRELESCAKMKPLLSKIIKSSKSNKSKISSKIKNLYKASKKASKTIELMLKEAEKTAPFLPGTFIVYDQKNDYALRGQAVSFTQKIASKILFKTNISHISVGFTSDNNQNMEAHMWGSPISKYAHSRRTLGNHCFQTIQMSIEKMVDTEKMAKLYGEDWKDVIHNEYASISREYFLKNPELKKLHNPSFKRVIAAIGFRFSAYKQSWKERCQFPKSHQVICSEFAVMSSLQCLETLETRIQNKWKEQYPEEITLPKITPPVRENRRLNRLLPNEIVNYAIKEGYATISPPAKCIQDLIQFNDDALIF